MRRFVLLLMVSALPVAVLATHNRAGEIVYYHVDTINGLPNFAPTYVFIITTYTELAAPSPPNRDSLELVIRYCDDTTIIARFFIKLQQPFTDVGNGLRKNLYISDPYTFPGLGCYTASMLDPNRIEGILNIPGSVQVPFYLEDTLYVKDPQFFGFNSSPVLLAPPIDFSPGCQFFVHNPAAYDPDGDSLAFSLGIPMADVNVPVPGYSFPDDPIHEVCAPPNVFTIDPISGDLTWDVCQQVGIYNVVIKIKEYREGILFGVMIRDMQIVVTPPENAPPILSEINDTCVIAGEHLLLTVSAIDTNAGQIVMLSAAGGPFFVTPNPATFDTAYGNPAVQVFNWQTSCEHVRPNFYTVVFKAQDDYDPPFVDVETWIIRVVAPPPTGLTALANGNQIDLAWDFPYACAGASNFRGFSVWRKAGCDSLVLDTCFQGSPASLGYTNISGLITAYNYTDLNVVRGIIYSYRVVAEFAQTSPVGTPYNETTSLPSNEACIELKKDVPIITHVDVLTTDVSNGQIEIRWVKPFADELDTIQNHGPYKYELYNIAGLGTPTNLIQTFTSPTFAGLNQTSFINTGLNTQDSQWNYAIRFFATDNGGQFYEIGASDEASSVFLSIQVGGSLKLNWNEEVPWVNYAYAVLKETPTGSTNFIPIDTVTTQTYTDFNVIIGELYCYKIRTYGSYFNPAILPDTLINHSQITCAIPIDTIPPCAPALTVRSACENPNGIDPSDLENILSWNNPNNSCADDVAFYNVYFAPTPSSPFSILFTTVSSTDTVFVHDNLTVVAGCYAVTAIDSFGNESLKSNIICLDNCPKYELPNVFTPNGDGSNELFIPFPYAFIDHVDIKIFTKWDNLVFQSTDPDINWDGTDQRTGKALNEGVYYYVCDVFEIRLDGVHQIEKPLSGYIHLIR